MQSLMVTTEQKRQIVDITDRIMSWLAGVSLEKGVCTIFVGHTTAAITTADLDPGTDQDMLDAFEKVVPKLHYRHPHDPKHTPDHILSAVIGTSITIPFDKKKLLLGTWQRVILVELDGPRQRNVILSCIATT